MNVKKITPKNFRRYGWIIEYPKRQSKSRKVNLFRIVLREPKVKGWRIAYLVLRDRKLRRLEQHPQSYESFEPVSGRSLIFIASRRAEKAIECFVLDKPVILKKGIWHGIVTLTPETDIKITENLNVQCVYWPLSKPFTNSSSKQIK